jgi:hypothetical protein
MTILCGDAVLKLVGRSVMVAKLLMSVAVAAATAFAANSALAAGCTGNLQFSDDFNQVNPAWQDASDVSIGGGRWQATAPDNQGMYWDFYQGRLVGDADICFGMSLDKVSDPTDTGAGPVFWQKDQDNYTVLLVAPNGYATIFAYQNGTQLTLSTWRASPALKTGAGAVNAIRLTLKGNSISTYFNDQLFYTVTGTQPKGGGFFGFAFESEKAGPNTWSFTNLKITDPSQ